MSETSVLIVSSSLVATLFGMLVALLGWLGNRIYSKLDELAETMRRIEGDLHERISMLDARITRVEAHVEMRRASDRL